METVSNFGNNIWHALAFHRCKPERFLQVMNQYISVTYHLLFGHNDKGELPLNLTEFVDDYDSKSAYIKEMQKHLFVISSVINDFVPIKPLVNMILSYFYLEQVTQ